MKWEKGAVIRRMTGILIGPFRKGEGSPRSTSSHTHQNFFWNSRESSKAVRMYLKLLLIGTLILAGLCLYWRVAEASVDPSQAVKAVVGEAEGEGFQGMVAVAEAIRNRGHLRGVYGLRSPRLKKAKKQVFVMASKAWVASADTNIVRGADTWGNKKDVEIFKRQAWFKNYEKTAEIGGHQFFREVR